jgi:hypothetical protein
MKIELPRNELINSIVRVSALCDPPVWAIIIANVAIGVWTYKYYLKKK